MLMTIRKKKEKKKEKKEKKRNGPMTNYDLKKQWSVTQNVSLRGFDHSCTPMKVLILQ